MNERRERDRLLKQGWDEQDLESLLEQKDDYDRRAKEEHDHEDELKRKPD